MNGRHVLIVDDSPVQLRTMIKLLKSVHYQISVASDGEEGIEAAKTHSPDIILMDVVMPGMNGFQATRQLSRYAETAHIPVIICSSKSTDSDRLWGLRQGAKDYLVKPIRQRELLNVISRQLDSLGVGGKVGAARYE